MTSLDIKRSIARRITLIAFLVVAGFGSLIAGIGIYMARDLLTTIVKGELAQISAVVSKTLEVELERAMSDAAVIAANPLVMNALMDSGGRNDYLQPFVSNWREQEAESTRISVHDFTGAELATNRAKSGDYAVDPRWHEAVLNGRRRVVGPDVDGNISFILPVIHPATQTAEGFVLWKLNLHAFLVQAAALHDKSASVSLNTFDGLELARTGVGIADGDLFHSQRLKLSSSLSELDLMLSVRQGRALISVPMNQLTLYSAIGGMVTLILAMLVATLIGRRIAAPVAHLTQIISKIDPNRLSDMPVIPEGDDEVGALGRSFSQMIKRLQHSHETLEQRVRERTIELERAETATRHQAFHDSLTDLPNRALLRDRLEQALHTAQRHGRQVAVMFLDLDRFKLINDSLGHGVGDKLLVTISSRLRTGLRKKDTIARLGGDEFVIMIDDFDSTDFLAKVAMKIVDVVSQPIEIDRHVLHASTSIGIAVYPDNGANVETLMQNADAAMYRAKDSGRNCFMFYHKAMNSRSVLRLEMETSLRRALETKEFELFFQPQVDLASGQCKGMEALLRWRHPVKGMISPIEFIPIAEESGLIIPIGEWVIGEACRQLKEWRSEGISILPVAVNVSARQFHDAQIVEKISDALKRNDLGPELLELEITESTAMSRSGNTMEFLNELRERGHSIVIDDFGTDYSSLSYLRQLPISGLKIDRSFVDGIGNNWEDETIVEAVLGIAKALGLQTVAEGVETMAQAEFLVAKGSQLGQGYFYTRPLPSAECAQWLRTGFGTPSRSEEQFCMTG